MAFVATNVDAVQEQEHRPGDRAEARWRTGYTIIFVVSASVVLWAAIAGASGVIAAVLF